MNAEQLYVEMINRFAPADLNEEQISSLQFACRKTIKDYPKRDMESLLKLMKHHLMFVKTAPNVHI